MHGYSRIFTNPLSLKHRDWLIWQKQKHLFQGREWEKGSKEPDLQSWNWKMMPRLSWIGSGYLEQFLESEWLKMAYYGFCNKNPLSSNVLHSSSSSFISMFTKDCYLCQTTCYDKNTAKQYALNKHLNSCQFTHQIKLRNLI